MKSLLAFDQSSLNNLLNLSPYEPSAEESYVQLDALRWSLHKRRNIYNSTVSIVKLWARNSSRHALTSTLLLLHVSYIKIITSLR
jgi:hypothetical protein